MPQKIVALLRPESVAKHSIVLDWPNINPFSWFRVNTTTCTMWTSFELWQFSSCTDLKDRLFKLQGFVIRPSMPSFEHSNNQMTPQCEDHVSRYISIKLKSLFTCWIVLWGSKNPPFEIHNHSGVITKCLDRAGTEDWIKKQKTEKMTVRPKMPTTVRPKVLLCT